MNKKIFSLLTAVIMLVSLFGITVSAADNTTYYVSLKGNDANAGTSLESPLATLTAARNKIRTSKVLNPNKSFTVVITEGRYNIGSSFTLAERDSGSAAYPITYKAYGTDKVEISSYYNIPVSSLVSVTDSEILAKIPAKAQSKVKMVALNSCGISSYGSHWYSGSNSEKSLLLYANDELQTIARWPNNDWALSGNILSTKPTVMSYTYEGTAKWINSSTARMYGGLQYLWAFESRKITAVDTETKTVTFADGAYKNSEKGKPYYVENLLEELDAPGEYYIDRTKGILYYYPIDGLTTLTITNLTEPLLTASNVSNITFENINFTLSGGIGYEFTSCKNILMKNCSVYNVGSNAAKIAGANNISIYGGEIYNTGAGIFMSGGDRNNLIGCNSKISEMDIHDVDTYAVSATCVNVTGVGITVENNKLHDIRHQAFSWTGNDIVFKGNEIYNVCSMSNDSGACYTGRNLTVRGNVFEGNYFHDIFGYGGSAAYCIYFDDNLSQHTVRNNVFYNVGTAVFIHGGSDHIIENNIFIKCNSPVSIPNYSKVTDAESMAFFDAHITNVAKDANGNWYDAWKSQYPEFVEKYDAEKDATDEEGNYEIAKAKNNIIRNNIYTNTTNNSFGTFATKTTIETGNRVRNLVMYK
ncbi:MAG: right-handed parallel beta-helix repeat-containing protein [Clostridia bacterium]|nr:right-handed parallel beta-helix repeat-containing protein [Clostridia bacterium]